MNLKPDRECGTRDDIVSLSEIITNPMYQIHQGFSLSNSVLKPRNFVT